MKYSAGKTVVIVDSVAKPDHGHRNMHAKAATAEKEVS